MENHDNQIKIKQLKPSLKHFTLLFEVDQIIKKQQKQSLLQCRIVDDTGIVNAYFNQYINHFQPGKLYKVKDLKVKIVDSHLRVEMGKNCQIQKLSLKITLGVKDKSNDLSEKIYINDNVAKQLLKKQQIKVNQPIEKVEKALQTKVEKNIIEKDIKIQSKPINHNPKTTQKVQTIKQEKIKKKIEGQDNIKTKKVEEKYVKEEKKVKYVQKKQISLNQNSKQVQKLTKNLETVLLKDIHKFERKKVKVLVWLCKDQRKQQKKYWLGTIADQTGSVRIQFDPTTRLEGNEWLQIDQLQVVGDKIYGYILVETQLTETKVWMKNVGKYNLKPIKFF